MALWHSGTLSFSDYHTLTFSHFRNLALSRICFFKQWHPPTFEFSHFRILALSHSPLSQSRHLALWHCRTFALSPSGTLALSDFRLFFIFAFLHSLFSRLHTLARWNCRTLAPSHCRHGAQRSGNLEFCLLAMSQSGTLAFSDLRTFPLLHSRILTLAYSHTFGLWHSGIVELSFS